MDSAADSVGCFDLRGCGAELRSSRVQSFMKDLKERAQKSSQDSWSGADLSNANAVGGGVGDSLGYCRRCELHTIGRMTDGIGELGSSTKTSHSRR